MNRTKALLIGTIVVLSVLLAGTIAYPYVASAPQEGGPKLLTSVPDVRQSTNYSCGAASLQAVLSYWGEDIGEGALMGRLHTSEANGTSPSDIVRVAQEYGYNVTMEMNMTIDDLASLVHDGVPVIIVGQAWTDNHSAGFSWAEDWDDGHYMVVIGVDSTYVYFEDPSLLGSRGKISIDEFNARWHDYLGTSPVAPDATILDHMGIIIRGDGPAQRPVVAPVL